jgi:GAF domain-containing protein
MRADPAISIALAAPFPYIIPEQEGGQDQILEPISKFDILPLPFFIPFPSLPKNGYIICIMNISNNLAAPIQVSADISTTMDGILALMGKELKVSRSYIFTVDPGGIGRNAYEWCRMGVVSQKKSLANFFVSKDWIMRLQKDGVILISDINQAELRIRAELGRQNIMSLAVVPLMNGEEIRGFLGMDECVMKNREWKPEEIQTLRRFAKLIDDVYQRINAEETSL